MEDVRLQYFDNCMAIKYETISIVFHYSSYSSYFCMYIV